MSLPTPPTDRPGNPVRTIAQVLAPFGRVRPPDETRFQTVLIVASAAFEKVNQLIEQAARLYPSTRLVILTDDRNEQTIAERWPAIDRMALHRASSRGEKLHLLSRIIAVQFDVCLFLAAGDLHYDFLKGVALLSGASYIRLFTERFDSFFFMLGQTRAILRHLVWRSKHQYFEEIPTVRISFLRSGVGYAISLVQVIPLLKNARRVKGMRNPFIDE